MKSQYEPNYERVNLDNDVANYLNDDKEINDNHHVNDGAEIQWQLPSKPFQMEIELDYIDGDDKDAIAEDLGLDAIDLDFLEFYADRLDGAVQSVLINDVRFGAIEDIPESLKTFLDGILFGESSDPVSSISGERITFWDAVRGDPETQQAFYNYEFTNGVNGISIHGGFDPKQTLDGVEKNEYHRLDDSIIKPPVPGNKHQNKHDQQTALKQRRKWPKRILFITVILSLGSLAVYLSNFLTK